MSNWICYIRQLFIVLLSNQTVLTAIESLGTIAIAYLAYKFSYSGKLDVIFSTK